MSRFVLFAALSVLPTVAVVPARADEAEDKAVAFVTKYGGKIRRGESLPGIPVVWVYLDNEKVDDAEWKALAPLKKLNAIHLLKITGQTLSVLREMNLLHVFDTAEAAKDNGRPDRRRWQGYRTSFAVNPCRT